MLSRGYGISGFRGGLDVLFLSGQWPSAGQCLLRFCRVELIMITAGCYI